GEPFNPVRPHQEEGMRTDPPVSVPKAAGTSPAAMAEAEPLLEPPEKNTSSTLMGLSGRPKGLTPQPLIANSVVWLFPAMIAPSLTKASMTAAWFRGTCDTALLPSRVGMPPTSIKSLTAMGTHANNASGFV